MNKHRIQPLRDFCEIPPRLFLGEELLILEFNKLHSLIPDGLLRQISGMGRMGKVNGTSFGRKGGEGAGNETKTSILCKDTYRINHS
jgi:hypothetical protein